MNCKLIVDTFIWILGRGSSASSAASGGTLISLLRCYRALREWGQCASASGCVPHSGLVSLALKASKSVMRINVFCLFYSHFQSF